MSEAQKVLGQAAPAATVLTALYTVPAGKTAVGSTLYVCNQNSGATIKFRVSVAINGAADTPAQYRFFDVSITKNGFAALTTGWALAAGDVVRVQTDTANVSFNLDGTEVS